MNKIEISPTQRIDLTSDGWTLNLYGLRAATIANPEGERIVSYFGFENEEKAGEFKNWLEQNKYCDRCIIRKSERLTSKIEVKVWKCPIWLIEDCFLAEANKLQTIS
ncbi:MAG: hypothetical protein HC815_05850 [Richelia sp. RM1_1_1]|nr:hypothetical protein [Richelia sp. RM1_1_1]